LSPFGALVTGITNAIWSLVAARWNEFFGKVRQVVGITKPTAIRFATYWQGVAQFKDGPAQFVVIFVIQTNRINQIVAFATVLNRANFAVVVNLHTITVSQLARVGREMRGL